MTRAALLAYIDNNVYPNANNEITALMVRDVLHRMVDFLGDAATYGVGDVALNDGGLVTGGAVQSAINTTLSSAIMFQGVTTTPLTDGSTNPNITIDGESYTAHRGDEVIYGGKEFLWTGTKWQQLGDEESWAAKTITISAGAGLTGGGNLTQNRTLSLSQDSLEKLALAASAYQLPQGGIPKADLASAVQNSLGKADTVAGYFSNDKLKLQNLPDLYVAMTQVSGTAANKTLYGVNGISAAAAADANDKSLIEWDDTNKVWHVHGGIYAEGVLSGGGLSQSSPGGGGGGLDPALMWKYLTNDPTLPSNPYANTKIAEAHLPDLNPGTGISASYSGNLYLNLSLDYSTVAGQLGLSGMAYKPANQQTIIDALGYTPANNASLTDYIPWSSEGNLSVSRAYALTTPVCSGNSNIEALQSIYSTAPKDAFIARYIYRNGTGAMAWGWFLNYTPDYGGFFVSNYHVPTWVGINGGVWEEYTILHSGNWSNYVGASSGTPVAYATEADTLDGHHGSYYNNLLTFYDSGATSANSVSYPLSLLSVGTPSSEWWYVTTMYYGSVGSGAASQIATSYSASTPQMHIRQKFDGTWSAWQQVYHSGNFNPGDYLPLAGGTMSNTNLVTNLNADYVDGYHLKEWTTPYSPRDFGSGTLIKTDFNYDGYEGEAFYLEIFGDMYGGGAPLMTLVQGYFYANTIIAYNTTNLGAYRIDNLIAMNLDGKICFWFPRLGYWQSFGVKCYSSSSGNYWRQRAVSIENSADPGGTRRVTLTNNIKNNAFHGDNYAANYITAGSTTLNTSAALYVYGVAYATTGIYTDGYLSGGGLSQSSDQRLKRFIEDFSYTPDLLMALRPREWEWNDKTPMMGHAAGFVAQEVEGLLPYMVDDTREYLALYYDQFHALEVAALQDHETRLVAIEKENEAIRKENVALRLENRQLRERLNMN